jgi:hypothetical protein
MEKGSGSTGGMQGHNERSYDVKNADPEKADLNFFVGHKDGKMFTSKSNPREGSYKSREDAIIEKKHTGRKIRANAVKRLSFALSGSHEQMKAIEKAGKIEIWAKQNYKFIAEKYGASNITEFAIHLDERTPHIHCMVVPMVKTEKGAKLCAKDLTSRDQLRELQSQYAERMKPFGLNRGLKGSRATHDSTTEYYAKIENELGELAEVRKEKHELYQDRDNAKEKFNQVAKMTVQEMKKEIQRLEEKIVQVNKKKDKGFSM